MLRRSKMRQKTTHSTAMRSGEQQIARVTSAPNRFALAQRSQARDAQLIDAILRIDTTVDPAGQRELMEWISQAYDDRGGGELVGLFGRCHLGHPYVDHRMSIAGSIIEHFTSDQIVPPPFTAGRPLARSDAYLFVEIYADGQVVPIRSDGSQVA